MCESPHPPGNDSPSVANSNPRHVGGKKHFFFYHVFTDIFGLRYGSKAFPCVDRRWKLNTPNPCTAPTHPLLAKERLLERVLSTQSVPFFFSLHLGTTFIHRYLHVSVVNDMAQTHFFPYVHRSNCEPLQHSTNRPICTRKINPYTLIPPMGTHPPVGSDSPSRRSHRRP